MVKLNIIESLRLLSDLRVDFKKTAQSIRHLNKAIKKDGKSIVSPEDVQSSVNLKDKLLDIKHDVISLRYAIEKANGDNGMQVLILESQEIEKTKKAIEDAFELDFYGVEELSSGYVISKGLVNSEMFENTLEELNERSKEIQKQLDKHNNETYIEVELKTV